MKTSRREFIKKLFGGAIAAAAVGTGLFVNGEPTVDKVIDDVLDKNKPIVKIPTYDTKDCIDWQLSKEALEDIRKWGIDHIDEETRKEIILNGDNPYSHHIHNINISCGLKREEIYELGRIAPYYRYASFPVEIKTTSTKNNNQYEKLWLEAIKSLNHE